jgi:hypothetical protein
MITTSKIKHLFALASAIYMSSSFLIGGKITTRSTNAVWFKQVGQSLIQLSNSDGSIDSKNCLEHLSKAVLLPEQFTANAANYDKLREFNNQIAAALESCSSSNEVVVASGNTIMLISPEVSNLIRNARDTFLNMPRGGDLNGFYNAIRQVHALILQAQAAQAKNQHANDQESKPYMTPDTDSSEDSSVNFGSYRLSPVHIVDATLPSGNDITDASVFGQYAVSSDLSNLLQQKAAAKRMLYARGYVPQPHKPLFVFSSTMTQCSNVDVLPEIASEILSLGGQLVVVANCGYFFYPKGVDKLLELRDSYSRTLKIYTNSYTISLPFRDTAVSNLDMIFFAADYMITAETSPTTQDDASLQTQVFPTVESALIHWQSLHGE